MSFLSEMMMLDCNSKCQLTTPITAMARRNSQLSCLSLRLDIISNDRDVSEVEGGVDFIHEVEWSRLVEGRVGQDMWRERRGSHSL